MVDISSQNNKINVTVSSSGNTANTNVTPDYAQYYSEKSKEWAISNRIVDNTDYSSKYYANESKKQADISTAKATEVVESGNNAVSNIENARNNAILDVNTAGATQVALATEQATIATNKASEVIESGNTALSNIDTAKNNAITSITNQETTSKTSLIDEGATQIGLIQNEGATQVANVQSTGFYMRDDKLYYINSQGEETEFKSGGSGLEICDIGMSLYVDETKGLRRYLNGQIVDINTNTQAFLNKLKDITTLHPSLLCTEEEWQTAKTMSAFGQVGKFVFNYNGADIVSVRLPRVVNVQGLFDLQNLGMTVGESLPNITGSMGGTAYRSSASSIPISGAFSGTSIKSQKYSGYSSYSGSSADDIKFDASYSSSTYQDNAPVQQEAIQYPYFIQIATGSETENNIINDIELNNPYSLFDSKYSDHELFNLSWLVSNGSYNGSNVVHPSAYQALLVENNAEVTIGSTVTLPNGIKYTKQGLSVKLSTETYTDYDFVLNTADETFRLPLKTKLASGKAVVGNGMTIGLTDGTNNAGLVYTSSGYNRLYSNISKFGSNVGLNYSGDDVLSPLTIGVTTDPTKSGIELSDSDLYLYYYVGETVQNANLIDAGRIGEQLASLTTVVETYQNGTSWYRIWSDGWCEQGGYSTSSNVTIKLLKTYANTNYTITLGKAFNNETNTRFPNIVSTTKTTAQFKVTGTYNNTTGTDCYFYWETKGYMV